jgi:hypothetical protein
LGKLSKDDNKYKCFRGDERRIYIFITHPSENKTTLYYIPTFMIMNLSKSFHFHRNQNEYRGNYLFRRNANQDGDLGLCLVLNVSVNDREAILYEVNKSTATLFLSNELIEEMVADEVVGFTSIARS